MILGLFRTERGRRALLGLSITAALAVACGDDNSSNPGDTGGGGGDSAGDAGAAQGGAAGGAAGSSGVAGTGSPGGTGTAGMAGGVNGGASGGVGPGGSGGSSGSVSSSGASGSSGAGGSGGSTSNGGSAGLSGGSAGTAGEIGTAGAPGAAGDDGAAGAADCGPHGCTEPTILANIANPNGLALDASYVYWTTVSTTGTVQRTAIGGGTAQPISTSEVYAFDLAVAGGNAFWLLNNDSSGHVVEASVTGSNRVQLATGTVTGFVPAVTSICSDGAFAYYVANFNEIARVPAGVANSAPTYISTGPFNSNIIDMVLFGGQLYYTNNGIYLSDYSAKMPNTAGIKSADPSGTLGSTTLVSQLNFPLFQIAVDSGHIFWNDDKNIYSTGLIGGLPTPLIAVDAVAGGASPVSDMVSDGTNLYYADAHTVYRVPVAGGSRHTVSSGWQSIQRLAVDANNVYFTDYDGGAVVQVAK
jgi:hypothetical protein